MNRKHLKHLLAIVLTLSMVLSLCPFALAAEAEDVEPEESTEAVEPAEGEEAEPAEGEEAEPAEGEEAEPAEGEEAEPAEGEETEPAAEPVKGEASRTYEPWKHGYRLVDVLNWSPETDNYAEELRANVPLQERNEPLAETQANPDLASDAQVYNVAMGNYRSTDTAEAPWNGGQYYDDFSYNLFKFWQYTDYIGAGGRPTSGFDSVTAKEQERYEYGVIGIPIAAFTNTAHKNGVKAIAEYFIPRDPQYTEEWLYKDEDGNFPYAQKMVEIANYYGFDGYFINQEGPFDASLIPLFKEAIQYMRSEGLYIQWYDSIADDGTVRYLNEFADYDFAAGRGEPYASYTGNYHWIQDTEVGRVADSIWLNYWWNENIINKSAALAEKLGLDPFESVFLGVECGYGKFEGASPDDGLVMSGNRGELILNTNSKSTVQHLDWILDEDGNPKLSFALWGGDFVHEQYGKVDNLRYTDAFQWSSEERERMWYTSPKESAVDHTADGLDRTDVEVATEEGQSIVWPGLSKYVAERSTINGSVFTTNFNTGHGMQYWINGNVSRDIEWSNMNLQDYMPTWQWWVDSVGEPLTLDWDYGSKQEKLLTDGTMGSFDYQQLGAYTGGSSLVAYGDLTANQSQYINLYKTDLAVTEDSTMSLTYNKPTADDSSALALGLTFKDKPTEKVLLPLAGSGQQTDGWHTEEISLADYAGREIAAIGVQILSAEDVTGYQVNLGEIKLSDGASHAPEAPDGLRVARVFDGTDEIQLTWNLDEDYDTVKSYHVYAVYSNGSEKFVTGAYADNMTLSKLENREDVAGFRLYAIGADGSRSKPAYIALKSGRNVSNIQTVSADGQLTVTWEEPESEFTQVQVELNYWYSDRIAPASVTVDKGVKKAVLDIGTEDGSYYLLSVTTLGRPNSTICYFGRLSDTYSEPYDGEVRIHADGGKFSLTTPAASDWYSLDLTMDGVTKTFSRHGGDKLYNIAMPENLTLATVIVEDMYGNRSEPVVFRFRNGELAELRQTVGSSAIPDEALRAAVFAKAGGDTYAKLLTVEGELDLTDLPIKDLTGIGLLPNVTSLNLSGTRVKDLTPVKALSNLTSLTAQKTQITALEENMLPASLESLDLTGCSSLATVAENVVSALPALKTLNLSNCRGLKELNLNNAGQVEVSLSNCTRLEKLVLTGTTMTSFDITGLSGLKEFMGNDSELAMLTADEATAYAAMTTFNISGSRFDLSAESPDRALVDGLAEIETIEFGGQRPEVVFAELPETLTVEAGSDPVETKTYFENIYLNSTTVRGTSYPSIVEEDWIAEDYDAAALCAVPGYVYVEITDSTGAFINEPEQPAEMVDVETNRALGSEVLGHTGQNSGEEATMLFDDSISSKWCNGDSAGWVAFVTGESFQAGRWLTHHAQANNEAKEFNTVDFELQVLNTEAVGMSEAEFLASDSKTNEEILADDANWTTIAHVKDNHEAIVDQEIDAAPEAQVYRLKVNQGYGDTPWGAIRFQELAMFAATNAVRDYEGVLSTTAGTYQIAFKKGLDTTLRTMEIVVE